MKRPLSAALVAFAWLFVGGLLLGSVAEAYKEKCGQHPRIGLSEAALTVATWPAVLAAALMISGRTECRQETTR